MKIINENVRSMIVLEKVKQPLNVVLRRQAQVFRCCQSALAPRRNTENQVTEAPLGVRRRQCALAQSGRSMIEMLGVLAIIGVLSVGGIMGYSKAMMRYRINKTIEQITYIAGNVRTAFANQGNYVGFSSSYSSGVEALKKAHIVPDDMWKAGYSTPRNMWEGGVSMDAYKKNSADTSWAKAFYITYYGIPEEACIELITQDWSNAQVKVIVINSYHFIPPVQLDTAVKICGTQNSIMFNFEADTSDSYWKEKIDATTTAFTGN